MSRIVFSIFAIALSLPNLAQADGSLFGKKQLAVGVGYFRPGNDAVRVFDSSSLTFAGGIGVPVNEVIDITGGLGYSGLSNAGLSVNVTTVNLKLLYHFETESALKPAVTIGSAYVNAASNAGITSQDQNEFGFSGGLAVEAEISERVIFGAEADFIRIAGSSYLSLNGELSFWLSDTVYLPISVGYASDEGDLLSKENL